MSESKIPFLVAHLIGNPIDAADTFIQLAVKAVSDGDNAKALQLLEEADKSIEAAKRQIDDFRNGKYS